MVKLKLYNEQGESVGEIEGKDEIFGKGKFRQDLVHQVVVAQAANKRQAIAHTKTRGEVRGGGKKPWQQKGTGRARHGSIRSPLWRGGGITFGPRASRNFSKKINRRTKVLATSHILSQLAREKRLFVLETLDLAQPKAKELFQKLQGLRQKLEMGRNLLIVLPEMQETFRRAGKNLENVQIVEARNINALDLLRAHSVIIFKPSLEKLDKILA